MNNIINSIYSLHEKNSILSELNLQTNKLSDLIKDVDYKSTANKKKKRENLILLNYSLKEFLSFDASRRYKAIAQNNEDFSKYNEKIIAGYLLKDNENRAIFDIVLNNLKYEDFLDLLLLSIVILLYIKNYKKVTIKK